MNFLTTLRRRSYARPILLLMALVVLGIGYSVVSPERSSAETDMTQQIEKGKALFDLTCSSCHGLGAEGTQFGPSLIGVGAASVDYVMYSGYACLAYFWADMARLAAEKLAAGTSDEAFYRAKIQTARFYFQRILPRTRAHVATMLSGAANLMDMKEEDFDLGY